MMAATELPNAELLADERLDYLYWSNLKLIQSPRYFCMGLDAVLLADFVTLSGRDKVVDLGTGTGAIMHLLWARSQTIQAVGVEILADVANAAARSIQLNGLTENLRVVQGDLREAGTFLPKGRYSLVVSNPPYYKVGSGALSPSTLRQSATAEVNATLTDVVQTAATLLNSQGRFACVHRPERLAELLTEMAACGIAAKRLRLVQSNLQTAPNMVLVEGIKNGNQGLAVLPTLLVWQQDGSYTAEMQAIRDRNYER